MASFAEVGFRGIDCMLKMAHEFEFEFELRKVSTGTVITIS